MQPEAQCVPAGYVTYNASWCRPIAADPLPIPLRGATVAVVLLGLRRMFGSLVGRDHALAHISRRLLPAVFLTLAYPVVVVRGIQLLNDATSALGYSAIGGGWPIASRRWRW